MRHIFSFVIIFLTFIISSATRYNQQYGSSYEPSYGQFSYERNYQKEYPVGYSSQYFNIYPKSYGYSEDKYEHTSYADENHSPPSYGYQNRPVYNYENNYDDNQYVHRIAHLIPKKHSRYEY